MNKLCGCCQIEKNVSEFHRDNRINGYRSYCKICHKQYQNNWEKHHPEKRKQYHKKWQDKNPEYSKKYSELNKDKIRIYKSKLNKSKYGLSEEQFNIKLQNQDYKCAICKTMEPGKKGWQIDHCHSTNQIRGLLCFPCNVGLGHFKDNQEILNSAQNYLIYYSEERQTE